MRERPASAGLPVSTRKAPRRLAVEPQIRVATCAHETLHYSVAPSRRRWSSISPATTRTAVTRRPQNGVPLRTGIIGSMPDGPDWVEEMFEPIRRRALEANAL